MFKLALSAIAASLLALSLSPNSAQAQGPARVFVAAQGSDANPCTFAQPCRTFQRAHDVVAAGGEIDVLDPAGYGALAINKAISIEGHGFAGITVTSGNAISIINAGAGDVVTLRGLIIKGIGASGNNGIVFTTGEGLAVENCTISNMSGGSISGKGIAFLPTIANAKLSISNTIVNDNAKTGIVITPTVGAPNISVFINRVEVRGNGEDGILIDGETSSQSSLILAIIAESVAAYNGGTGFHAFSTNSGALLRVRVVNSLVIDNGLAGVGSDGGGFSFVFLSGNTFLQARTGSPELSNPDNRISSTGDNNMNDTVALSLKH